MKKEWSRVSRKDVCGSEKFAERRVNDTKEDASKDEEVHI